MTKPEMRWCLVLAVLCMAVVDSQAGTPGRRSVIQAENEKAGTTDWLLTKIKKGSVPPRYAPVDEEYDKGWRRRKELEGYCSHTSIRAGETLDVFVSTDPVDEYKADIYRMGYYGGSGARLMRTLGPLQGSAQPTPQDGARHLIECRWSKGFTR